VDQIRQLATKGRKAVVIGGGYIGLETSAVLKRLGMEVTILEAASRILERVTTPEISAFYTRIHIEEGVEIHTDAVARSIEGATAVKRVVCSDGQVHEADLVIIGIGIMPATELAEAAGLKVDNGIVVDEYARTSDPDILAAGDCTSHYNPIYQRNIRLESVQNATDQATVAANTICGNLQAYDALPWFWSDQYDIELQIAGLSEGFDQAIMRGDMESSRSFAVFYLKSGQVLAVDAVSKPMEFMIGKRLITRRIRVDQAKLSDETVPMKEILNG
jgi:3-phenylpropionate/trans-cinnamate dioxygenase ferredoxin reductase subunit